MYWVSFLNTWRGKLSVVDILTAIVHCGVTVNDANGMVIEELTKDKNVVWLNDGRSTRFNTRTGAESAIDLTLVSDSIAGVS